MRLFSAIRQRAQWIEAQAEATIQEHSKNAYSVALEMERQANDIGAKLSWHAIRKVILARAGETVDLLPPVPANNCIACLVHKISGAEGPPNFQSCSSCVMHIGRGSYSKKLEVDEPSKPPVWPDKNQMQNSNDGFCPW
jgi:hypothetical protein